MRECIFSVIAFFFIASVQAQAPEDYYNTASGKTGGDLRIALYEVIKNHEALSYSGLWSAFYDTDLKPGTDLIWDIYSDNPGGESTYDFVVGSDQCSGTAASDEGFCYNREHTWPQSKFAGNKPMHTDLWLVYPTDAYVNEKRSDYPYGEVSSPSWTSENGSRVGMNAYPGSPETLCLEPHDSFKGDIARTYFYISTRYYSEDEGWSNWEMAIGADLKPWVKTMLLDWHHQDPVSQKEIDRNNAVYAIQKNRNPFIDHPEFADCIFGTEDCTGLLSVKEEQSQSFHIYPNPSNDIIHIEFGRDWEVNWGHEVTYELYNYLGKICQMGLLESVHTQLNISDLSTGVYFLKINNGQNIEVKKIIKGFR